MFPVSLQRREAAFQQEGGEVSEALAIGLAAVGERRSDSSWFPQASAAEQLHDSGHHERPDAGHPGARRQRHHRQGDDKKIIL